MSLAEAHAAYDQHLDTLWRSMAERCEADARQGIDHPLGDRCAVCPQAIPNGCKLRLRA